MDDGLMTGAPDNDSAPSRCPLWVDAVDKVDD
jgi:hypothetical protein